MIKLAFELNRFWFSVLLIHVQNSNHNLLFYYKPAILAAKRELFLEVEYTTPASHFAFFAQNFRFS